MGTRRMSVGGLSEGALFRRQGEKTTFLVVKRDPSNPQAGIKARATRRLFGLVGPYQTNPAKLTGEEIPLSMDKQVEHIIQY